MLSSLYIENIALIEAQDISFKQGLNVLTGETGAGKSIVLDSIGAILGERVSRDLIRTGEKIARVTAVFCNLPQLSWFDEMGIYPDENKELIISRQLSEDGKNICRVSGVPCTVAQLKALGRQLIHIHGQHDSQQLLDEKVHLTYLDSFGGLHEMVEEFAVLFEAYATVKKEIASLMMDEAEKSRRIDTLQYQIDELSKANLQEGEMEDLTNRREILRNSGKLMEAIEGAYLALTGDEEQSGAVSLLGETEKTLSSVSSVTDEIEQLANEVSELYYAVDDVAEKVRDLKAQFDFSPYELDEVESRLDVLYRLRKKYGQTTEEMLSYFSRIQEELEAIEVAEDTIANMEIQAQKLHLQAMEKAQELSQKRRVVADHLQEKIEEELRQLDMPNVRFYAKMETKDAMDQQGLDYVQFFMSANIGEELKPIQKVASGGELSRIMLALKNVLAENDFIPTLIFDEVDVGVSGRAGQKVAEKMAQLSSHRQILCVTHLTQIASMADEHFSVRKGEKEGRTYTYVCPLSEEERVGEISRLTGGEHISDAIMEGAKELLIQAQTYKKQLKV